MNQTRLKIAGFDMQKILVTTILDLPQTKLKRILDKNKTVRYSGRGYTGISQLYQRARSNDTLYYLQIVNNIEVLRGKLKAGLVWKVYNLPQSVATKEPYFVGDVDAKFKMQLDIGIKKNI